MATTPLQPEDPRRLGDVELVGRLGAGGMGMVFLGRRPDGALVAVKVIRPEWSADPEFLGRFRREARQARRVPPFCTAAVVSADVDHVPPYFVVEFVDGASLAEVVRYRGPLTGGDLYGIAVGVATALVAIHGAGVVHRDLKPGNVLLAAGMPKVIDFGIARGVEFSEELTRPGQVVGTLAYLAPECLGDTTRVGPPADVFAWGVLVAWAATGRTPFAADSPLATMGRIVTQPPDLDGLAAPLRHLVEKALAKDPGARPTAAELLGELVAGGRDAVVRPELRNAASAARSRVRRASYRRVFAGAAAVIAFGAAGLAAVHYSMDASRQADRAALEATRADQRGRDLAAQSLMSQSASMRATDPGLALRMAMSAQALAASAQGRAAVNRALATGYDGELGSGSDIRTARFGPGGTIIAAGGNRGVLGLWKRDGQGYRQITKIDVGRERTFGIAFTSDGRTLAAIGDHVRLWDVSDPSRPRLLSAQAVAVSGDGNESIGFDRGGNRLLIDTGRVTALWDVTDRRRPRPVWSTPAPADAGAVAAISADGVLAAGSARNGALTIWRLGARGAPRPVAKLPGLGQIAQVAFSPDHRFMALARYKDGILLYDISRPDRPRRVADFARPADGGPWRAAVAFDPTGRTIAVSGNREVTVWNLREPASPRPLSTYRGAGGAVLTIDFSPDGTRLIAAGGGVAHTAVVWRLAGPLHPQRRAKVPRSAEPYAMNISGDEVATVRSDLGLTSFDLRDATDPRAAGAPVALAADVDFDPIVRVSATLRITQVGQGLYDVTNGEFRRLLPDQSVAGFDERTGLAAAYDSSQVDDRPAEFRLYRLTTGRRFQKVYSASTGFVTAAAFSSDGRTLVAAQEGGPGDPDGSSVAVWDLSDPAHVRPTTAAPTDDHVFAVAVSGDVVAYNSGPGIKIWNFRSGLTRSLTLPTTELPSAMMISPDGSLLAVASDGGVRLWGIADEGDPIALAAVPEATAAAFSVHRPILATAGRDALSVWDVSRITSTLAAPLTEACSRSTSLTPAEWRKHVPGFDFHDPC